MKNIKLIILNYIKENDCTTFTEIESIFEKNGFDYRGNLLDCSGVNDRVIFWSGWNQAAYAILTELLQEGEIYREPASPIVVLTMGKALNLPIVTKNVNYKSDHWLPIMFRPAHK